MPTGFKEQPDIEQLSAEELLKAEEEAKKRRKYRPLILQSPIAKGGIDFRGSAGLFYEENQFIQKYVDRVEANDGVVEDEQCLTDYLYSLVDKHFKHGDFGNLCYPSGYGIGELYGQIPEDALSNMAFARTSSATRTNSDGEIEEMATDIPRLDYSDGDCPVLLLEDAATNLVAFSEDISQEFVSGTDIITINQAIAPDGEMTADRLVADGSSNWKFATKTVIAETDYIFTFYCKNNGGTASNTAIYDNSNASFILSTSSYFNQINDTEWSRVEIPFTTPIGCTSVRLYISRSEGLGNSDRFIWGTQLEIGSVPSTYIPTEGTTVTRAAESLVQQTPNADMYNSEEGVLWVDMAAFTESAITNRYITLSNGSTNEYIYLSFRNNGTQIALNFTVGGASQAFFVYSPADITSYNKVAIRWKVNDFSMWANGSKIDEDLTGSVSLANTYDRLRFRNAVGDTFAFYGKVRNYGVATRYLSDEEMVNLLT